jgi:hypothetical protein
MVNYNQGKRRGNGSQSPQPPQRSASDSAIALSLVDKLAEGMTRDESSPATDSLAAFYQEVLSWPPPDYQTIPYSFDLRYAASHNDAESYNAPDIKAPIGRSLIDVLEDDDEEEVMVLAPPGHAKSTIGCTYAAWRLGRNPNLRVMVATHTTTYSQSLLRFIENIISTDFFKDVFGDLIPAEGTARWTASEKQLIRTEWKSGHPSLLALGVGSSTIGYRSDLIICDDLVTQQNSMTDTQRNHLSNWYWGSLAKRLEPGGKIIVIGARFYKGDLYGTLLDEYTTLEFFSEPENPLWPERYGSESLEKARRQNFPMFLAQYCQTPIDLSTQLLREEDLHYYVEAPDNLTIFIGVDPTVKAKSSSSRTPDKYAISVGGYDGSQIYILELIKASGNKDQQIDRVKKVCDKWHPNLVLVEAESAQVWLFEDLIAKYPNIPAKAVTSGGVSKSLRLTTLSTYFKNETILLPGRITNQGTIEESYKANEFLIEWRGYPNAGDHLLDATEIMSRGVTEDLTEAAAAQGKSLEDFEPDEITNNPQRRRSLSPQSIFSRSSRPTTLFDRRPV